MISRKIFLIKSIISIAALTVIGKAMGKTVKAGSTIKSLKARTALVVWYSQTGHTERVGKAVAAAWKKAGLKVDYGDYRDIDKNSLSKYDIIAAGSPVYYYEVPENFSEWLSAIPYINGKPVAAYVTFGGEGGNQFNTACELANLLADKGGVPLGTAEFSCMSAYAFTWSSGNVDRILKYSDRPNKNTYKAAGDFAIKMLANVEQGNTADISGNFDLRNVIKGSPSILISKLLITGHKVNTDKCISCGKCERACTVNAINSAKGTVDTGKCIVCLGCINNCPTGAVEMKFLGKQVYGYREFLKKNNIIRVEPEV
ncbi:MAG: EFR1 family ferrodoxin [Spirochaetes bacterium]|nr:EFR1 family ferrodoxin [Spirochaetota bacterium]